MKKVKSEDVAKQIEGLAEDVYSMIKKKKAPEIQMPLRALANVKYDPKQGYFEILDKVMERKGVVCINWHNETSAPEYGWYSTYQDVLRWMKDNGACTYTIKEVYDRLTSEG